MYVFLDVDGVLNTKAEWSKKVYSLNSKCVSAFCKLIKKIPDCKIVLSSTWRNGIARDGTTAVHIDELIMAISCTGIKTLDKTAVSSDGIRSKEIDYFLRRHPADSYIILDDDPELFELKEKTKGLYLINAVTGITEKDVKNIIKIL